MKKNNAVVRIFWGIISSSLLFFSTTGCTTFKNFGTGHPFIPLQNRPYPVSDAALPQFISSLKPIDGEMQARYRLARYFQEKGKHTFAVDELRNLISTHPADPKAYNALGMSYDCLGQFDLAIEAYHSALKLSPNLDYVYNNMGFSYLLNKNPGLAIQAFTKAIALNRKNAKYRNNLGLAYARKGQFDLAYSEFKKAAGETIARNNIARLSSSPVLSGKTVAVSGHPGGITTTAATAALPSTENMRETPPPVRYTVQIGAFRNKQNAEHVIETLAKEGYQNLYLNKVEATPPYYRVRMGCFAKRETPDNLVVRINHSDKFQSFTAIFNNPAKTAANKVSGQYRNETAHPAAGQDFDIEISNGNGVRHMARRIGKYLGIKGFRVARLSNAVHFNHPETKVFYRKGHAEDARRIAQEIFGHQKDCAFVESNKINREIKVLIGKDLILFDDRFRYSNSRYSTSHTDSA